MADSRTFVIAGAGLAGAKAAEALRQEGFEGRVVLVGSEPVRPYERPPLSKDYLQGKATFDDAAVHVQGFYAEHDVELLTGVTATTLDAAAHRLTLDDGRTLDYDRLLIATGAVPRRPPIPGADLEGVQVLRSFADAEALRERLTAGGPLAVVGAGWIGCEVAASARGLGIEVSMIERGDTPLERVLGAELGGFFAELHRGHGVDLHAGAQVERFEGEGRVRAVRLADGTEVACDTVVLGVGVAPDTRLAETGGLELDDGVVTDARLRTSAPDVFAAGDVAAALHPRYGRRIRVEHWANALEQGTAAGRSMLDRLDGYTLLPFFFSDQYDVGLEYFGLHGPSDRLVIDGPLASDGFRAIWHGADGRVTAAMHVNDWDASEELKALVERGAPAEPAGERS
jgi:3-phenylpropionate/trans-cinnamate dioxygenase ferredoxin reductase component